MAIGTLAPALFQVYTDADFLPLVGGKLASYLAGTSTPTPVYTDASLLVPHTNPIILDAEGRVPGNGIYLAALSYKFILRDANDVVLRTQDNVQAVQVSAGLGTVGVEVFTFGGDPNAFVTATAYPVGATLDKTHGGTAVYHQDSGNIPAGEYRLEGMILAGGGGTFTLALVNLSDGAPETPLVTIASASTTGARVQSSTTITFATPGTAKDYAIKSKVDTGYGQGWGLKLMRTQ